MTPAVTQEINEINARIDHTSALALIVSESNDLEPRFATAIRGIAETLSEIATRLDEFANPPRAN